MFLNILSDKVGQHNHGAMIQAMDEMYKKQFRKQKDQIELGEGIGPQEETL